MVRKSGSFLLGMYGRCDDCGAEWHANNSLGVAARHTDATGHRTVVEVTRGIYFEHKRPQPEHDAARE